MKDAVVVRRRWRGSGASGESEGEAGRTRDRKPDGVRLWEWRTEPPREPEERGVCSGCGEAIVEGEEWLVFESGRKVHADADCKLRLVDRMLGLRCRREEVWR